MKVSCIQVDGKLPNLALMKLAAWHMAHGDEVSLEIDGTADKAYISVIWPQNRARALGIAKFFPNAEVEIGGSGFNYSMTLPDEVEHTMPAYDLWGIDYSLGFTSRGCIRNCAFCIVPKKEGGIRAHSPIEEFVHPDHSKVVLLDNNLLASPNWGDTLSELTARSCRVDINQGLDIRLVNEDNAAMLADLRYYNSQFTTRTLRFAFDSMEVEKDIRQGIGMLTDAGIPSAHLMVYVLVGFDTTFDQDMRRYQILWEDLGAYPFVMLYNNTRDPTLRAFARWVNRRVHKTASWMDYQHGAKKAGEMTVKS